MLGLLWYISLQHWHTIWVRVQVLPDPLPTQLFGKWAEADLGADLLPIWKVLVEFRVPIFWHYPAVAVVGIWELSQQIEDLSLCLSLCVSITLPFKQIGRLKKCFKLPIWKAQRDIQTGSQRCLILWFIPQMPTIAGTGPYHNQELGTQSRLPMWMAEIQLLAAVSQAFKMYLVLHATYATWVILKRLHLSERLSNTHMYTHTSSLC